MSLVSAINLAHLPPNLTVHAALFTHVENAAFLRAQLLAGNPAFEYALIDASTLLSTAHALAAVFRAVNDSLAARLRCRNVHAETVFALSPNNNIAEAFRTFGVADGTRALLAIKIGDASATAPANSADGGAQLHTLESVTAHLIENIQGTLVPFCDAEIARVSDLATIRKAYKLNANTRNASRKQAKGGGAVNGHADAAAGGAGPREGESERKEIEITVLGMMALKGS